MIQTEMDLRGGSHLPDCHREAQWRPPDMATLPNWQGAKRIGIDTETKDADIVSLGPGVRRPGNYMVGVSFAIDGGPKFYLPFAHAEGVDNLNPEQVIAYLKYQFKTYDGEIVGANLPYDLDWLWEAGIEMPKVKFFRDVQVADPLIYELHDSYNLESISKRHGFAGKNEEELRKAARGYRLKDVKGDLWRMPARHVGPYAEDDAELPLKILRSQDVQIDADNIRECWDMECRVLPVLLRMQRRGVRIDTNRLDQIEEWTKQREQEQFDIIAKATGVQIPVGQVMNVDLLSRALRAADLPVGTNSKGDSVSKELLQTINHPVAKAILRARQVSTVRTTFVNGVRRHMVEKAGTWRIHTTFNQIRKTDDDTGETAGVAYGRLSSSHPNLQNQPGNSRFSGDNEVGPMWRSIYCANEGEIWAACDLKQQEPKWSFHYCALLEKAGVSGAEGALEMCARLQADPTLDTYDPIVQVAGVKRPTAKIMWLARCYGQGDGTLCKNLGLPTQPVTYSKEVWKTVPVDSPEGQRALESGSFQWEGAGPEGAVIIEKFDKEMPFLKTGAKLAKKQAEKNGFVKLLSGRRCHFQRGTGGKYEWTHKAFNRIIQGTSAEQTKRIMLAVAAESDFEPHMILQVHDELDFSFPDEQYAKRCAEVMRHAVPMLVPTVVDVETGPTWGESMGIEYVDADGKKRKVTYTWGMQIIDGKPVPSDDLQLVRGGASGEAFKARGDATRGRE